MIREVTIYDFQAGRTVYVLRDEDFAEQQRCLMHGDPLLESMQDNPIFAGRQRWCDLDLMHFHLLILNILRIIATCRHIDAPKRLIFFLCSLVSLLQRQSQSTIELLRITRLAENDLIYDYSASLDISVIVPNRSHLRLVINQ